MGLRRPDRVGAGHRGDLLTDLISITRTVYGRYKRLGEEAIAQLDDDELGRRPSEHVSSVATIVWHIAGNLESRFTDFLTSDGEKPWRDRESEFEERSPGRDELLAKWEAGWSVLLRALDELEDDDLAGTVTIRGVELTVAEALQRSLSHTAYHVGQMVYLGRLLRGGDWRFLSIPPGESEDYNQSLGWDPGSA